LTDKQLTLHSHIPCAGHMNWTAGAHESIAKAAPCKDQHVLGA